MIEVAKFFVALILALFLMMFAGRAIKEIDRSDRGNKYGEPDER
jgi:hypothetical protein